jgi:hypothetical protein
MGQVEPQTATESIPAPAIAAPKGRFYSEPTEPLNPAPKPKVEEPVNLAGRSEVEHEARLLFFQLRDLIKEKKDWFLPLLIGTTNWLSGYTHGAMSNEDRLIMIEALQIACQKMYDNAISHGHLSPSQQTTIMANLKAFKKHLP